VTIQDSPEADLAAPPLAQTAILRFWAPLSAQWLMMSVEGPFLAAVIARMAEPTVNLAAYGVAFAFAILFESPVIMLMSASVALVGDSRTYRLLRNFTNALNAACTALLLVMLVPGVFDAVMRGLLELPARVTVEVYGSLWLLLPWPAAIGYRRFLHGVLIRAGRTHLVAYGTVLRLAAMMGAALALRAWTGWSGARVGAGALSAGVIAEALVTSFMAWRTVRALRAGGLLPPPGSPAGEPENESEAGAAAETVGAAAHGRPAAATSPGALDYVAIWRFYYPLALTSLIGLTVQPILTFFMGRAPSPVESLAVFPVVHAASFFFRAPGLSFQEAAIALLGEERAQLRPLARFAATLAVVLTVAMAALAFTPLADVWFLTVSGLPPELARAALAPLRIALLLPALTVLLSLQSAVLVQQRLTRHITWATAIEVTGIATLFLLLGWGVGWTGASAAFAGLGGGRVAANLYLGYIIRQRA
jgi:hypothetical protein